MTTVEVPPNSNLDTLWSLYVGKNVEFVYPPGLYQTSGWYWQKRQTAWSGASHVGAGFGKTVIQLIGASTPTADGIIWAQDGTSWISGFSVSGITADCNAAGNPKFTNGLGTISAINLGGCDTVNISNCCIEGFGAGLAGQECFPVCMFGQSVPGTMHDIMVQNCFFMLPAIGNKGGLTVVAINDHPAGNVLFANNNYGGCVEDCVFIDCASDFAYCHCTGAPLVQNNIANDTKPLTFWYEEPIWPQWTTLPGAHVIGNTVSAGSGSVMILINSHSGGSIMCPIGAYGNSGC